MSRATFYRKMKEYKLAGTAAWALGQETSDVWPLIQQYVN